VEIFNSLATTGADRRYRVRPVWRRNVPPPPLRGLL